MTQQQTKSRILYIDDNSSNLKLVAQILGHVDQYIVETVQEPDEGLRLARQTPPDLILLDINLRGIDGFDVFSELQAHASTRHIPVIAISANVLPQDIQKAKEAGFADYITKPFEIERLLEVAENYTRVPADMTR